LSDISRRMTSAGGGAAARAGLAGSPAARTESMMSRLRAQRARGSNRVEFRMKASSEVT
jgi:hypothetical protein